MSKGARLKARRAQQATRPAVQLDHARVADAIHQAVAAATVGDGVGACVRYAWGGAAVLSVLTGQRWYPQAGEAIFQIDPENDPGACFGWNPVDYGTDELHAWCARMPPSGSGLVTEMADFSVRTWPQMAGRAGVPLSRELPDFFWGSPAGAHKIGIAYKPDVEALRRVESSLEPEQEALEQILRVALMIYRNPGVEWIT